MYNPIFQPSSADDQLMPEDAETFISNFGSYPGENEEL
jgi:hypothetical protein